MRREDSQQRERMSRRELTIARLGGGPKVADDDDVSDWSGLVSGTALSDAWARRLNSLIDAGESNAPGGGSRSSDRSSLLEASD